MDRDKPSQASTHYEDEDRAQQALRRSGVSGRVVPTGPLRQFLTLRAEEGFAGALLDEACPRLSGAEKAQCEEVRAGL